MADPTKEAPQGQASGSVEIPAQGTVSKEQGPFFEYDYGNGQKVTFASKDELAKAWRKSFLQESDYTRKSMENAQQRKQFEDERKKFQEEQKALTDAKKRYDDWDRALKSRPDVYLQLSRMADSPASPEAVFDRSKSYADEQLKAVMERLDAQEKMIADQRQQKEIDDVFGRMKGKYEDFDPDATTELLEHLQDGKIEPLIEILHLANKGRISPAQAEERISQKLEEKKVAGLMPSKGMTSQKRPRFKTPAEAREAAMRDAGLVPGG